MKKLVNKTCELYKKEIEKDPTNTDALYFILEDIGSELNEDEFNQLQESVNKKLGL